MARPIVTGERAELDARNRRSRRSLAVFSGVICLLCAVAVAVQAALLWRQAVAADANAERLRAVAIASATAERLRLYRALASQLARTEELTRPADAFLDDLRFQQISRTRVASLAQYDGVRNLLSSDEGVTGVDGFTAPIVLWQATRGLSLRSASGRLLAESRRRRAAELLGSAAGVTAVGEFDEYGRVVWLVPYERQVALSRFSFSELVRPGKDSVRPSPKELSDSAAAFTVRLDGPRSDRTLAVVVSLEALSDVLPLPGLVEVSSPEGGTAISLGTASAEEVGSWQTLQLREGLRVRAASATAQFPSLVGPDLWVLFLIPLLAALGAVYAGHTLHWRTRRWANLYYARLEAVGPYLQVATQGLAHDFNNTVFRLHTFGQTQLARESRAVRRHYTALVATLYSLTDTLERELPADAAEHPWLSDVSPEPRLRATFLRGAVEQVVDTRSGGNVPQLRISYRDQSLDEPFVQISDGDLIRILQNLVDNAIDATGGDSGKTVQIEIAAGEQFTELRVIDQGCGIPETLVPKVFDRGVTTKQTAGGTGLSVALELAERWQCTLRIERTEPGAGSVFLLRMPTAQTPVTFVKSLEIRRDTVLVVVDDEPHAKDGWTSVVAERFQTIRGSDDYEPKIIWLDSPAALRSNEDNALDRGTMFLVDYDLKSSENGLQLIEALDLREKAILVTNYAHTQEVLRQASVLGVRVISKRHLQSTKVRLDLETQEAGDA